MTTYTVLVNSSDGYRDAWDPFFALLAEYWPEVGGPIVLNTERAEYARPPLSIRASRVQERSGGARRLSWSECLLACLDQITTPLLIYLHEDYFLDRPVQAGLVEELAGRMAREPDIRHIGLTNFGDRGPYEPTSDPRLSRLGPRARYRISTQVGLWRVETLRSYLRPGENAWMFEIYGTRRAWRRREAFLAVSRERYGTDADPVFHYTPTGIIKGKWHPAMPALFEQHGIPMDFARRGFYVEKPRLLERMHTLRALAANPVRAVTGLLGR